ncbi:hypothetical protein ACIGEP_15545 [Microbacterium sp. NPDC077663]|uniref:phage major capsid protein n=1 Tax=Microbacterium sp. NPDC077663 TaxID=3364189 RepID=UPI0037CA1C48
MTEHGTYSYDPATRTVRGILMPFGEATSAADIRNDVYSADTIHIPADPEVLTLNRQHNRFDPIGRATVCEVRDAGVYTEYRIAKTPQGDAWLAEHVDEYGKLRPTGKLRKLSAEVTDIVRQAGRIVSARLTGAALVTEGAFASAALYEATTSETHNDTYTDEDGVTWRRVEEVNRATDDDGTTVVTSTVVTSTEPAPTTTDTDTDTDTTDTDADEAEEDKEEEYRMTLSPTGAAIATPRPTLDGLYAAIARNDRESLDPFASAGELFALKTVQHSGTGDKTIGTDTAEPGFLGELWKRAPFMRRIIPLLNVQTLTSYKATGWRWVSPPEVGDYAGNTAEVPSNELDTESVEVTAQRLAGGHRIDRRFRDFGDTSVIASYIEHQTDDYKRKSDAKAGAAVLAAATVTAPGAVPAGISKGLAAIVDGALAVIATENSPSYALVDPTLWRDILLTPKDDILAYLEASFGFEQGSGPGFSIRPYATGGKVIVGAREALTYWELPGEAPIRVDGLVPGNGAEDIAVFGYYASLVNNAEAIRSVTPAAAGA